MQYTQLGRTGVRVSTLCFGTMSFGGEADEQTSAAMYRRCREIGINFFDTANVYTNGRSEEILGKLIQGERDQIVLTSKVCGAMGSDINDRGLSRRHISTQVEATLKRLQTDRLDLYFVHNFDDDTPIDETLRALDHLVSLIVRTVEDATCKGGKDGVISADEAKRFHAGARASTSRASDRGSTAEGDARGDSARFGIGQRGSSATASPPRSSSCATR